MSFAWREKRRICAVFAGVTTHKIICENIKTMAIVFEGGAK